MKFIKSNMKYRVDYIIKFYITTIILFTFLSINQTMNLSYSVNSDKNNIQSNVGNGILKNYSNENLNSFKNSITKEVEQALTKSLSNKSSKRIKEIKKKERKESESKDGKEKIKKDDKKDAESNKDIADSKMTTVLKDNTSTSPLIKNQVVNFPDYNQAPIDKEKLKETLFDIPLLSKSLNELDPNRKYKLEEIKQIIRYVQYGLTLGEFERLFEFIDANKDALLSIDEWEPFVNYYVLPFEACINHEKSSKDILKIQKKFNIVTKTFYFLTREEFKLCIDKDPKTKYIETRRRNRENYVEFFMKNLSNNSSNKWINFFNYFFISKAAFAWEKCANHAKYISATHFRCAISNMVPNKYYLKVELDHVYKIAVNFAQQDKALIELDFLDFIRTANFVFTFVIFNYPNDNFRLEKNQFIKSIRENRLPNNFTEKEIEGIYSLTNTNPLNFEAFCFFINLHQLFNWYSIEKPFRLNLKEYLNLLRDPYTPIEFIMLVDLSESDFSESEYQEVSLVIQRLRSSEKNFYYGFKENLNNSNVSFQDASASSMSINHSSSIFSSLHDVKPNLINRRISYNTFTIANNDIRSLYKSFLFAKLFNHVCDGAFFCYASKFPQQILLSYDKIIPSINMKLRLNSIFYKHIFDEFRIDFLAFLALENYLEALQQSSIDSTAKVNETLVKKVLKSFGMENMPDTVIDTAKVGYDSLRRREYRPEKLIINTIIVQIAASERKRNKKLENGLIINLDPSRKFPVEERRHQASPFI